MTETVDTVLSFWLEEVGEDQWYKSDPALDEAIRSRFLGLWTETLAAGRVSWPLNADSALAACILLDQFPRNMFRGTGRSFDSDPLARRTARTAIDADLDLAVAKPQRQFFYMPFCHSEDPSDQDFAVASIGARLQSDDTLLHAEAHREVIRRFGRFPFRNEALGRKTTPAEADFLEAGGYPAIVRDLRESQAGLAKDEQIV